MKYLILLNPKEGRKGGEGNEEQMGQRENKPHHGIFKANHTDNHIKCTGPTHSS